MQILGRIGPTVSIKSGDLDFGLRQPQRSDLTSSGPPFWGSQTTLILRNFLIGGPTPFLIFGHPYKTHANLVRTGPTAGPVISAAMLSPLLLVLERQESE